MLLAWAVALPSATPAAATPGTSNCTVHRRDAPLDHFDFSERRTYKQRYFLYDRYWARPHGPILFYTGNEANVELCKPALRFTYTSHASDCPSASLASRPRQM